MVIRELLEIGKRRLNGKAFVDSIKESVFILSKVLDVDKSYIYVYLDKEVAIEQEEKFLEIVNRRSKGEPIAYIFNEKEFMGINLFVEKGVLIPRPETEILVEYIINYIKSEFKDQRVDLLDIGIGSGAISLSLAKKCKNTHILGVDISDIAIKTANKNLDLLGIKNVNFRKSNLFEDIEQNEKFAIIVSNPPYIKTDVIIDLQDDVKKFEPSEALDGGDDGLSFYRRISRDAKEHLLYNGVLIYEIGYDQGASVKEIMVNEGFKNIEIVKDFQELDRIVVGFIS